jgi:NifB/MoaA-like Fe-S oxidoreductase
MAPVFREMADNLRTVENLSVAVTALRNSLFGGSVTVAGLITGADVVSALREVDGDCVVLSRSMFDAELRHTIDGWGVDRMATAVGREMIICASPQELLAATLGEQQPFRGARGPAVPRTVGNEAGEKTCAAS